MPGVREYLGGVRAPRDAGSHLRDWNVDGGLQLLTCSGRGRLHIPNGSGPFAETPRPTIPQESQLVRVQMKAYCTCRSSVWSKGLHTTARLNPRGGLEAHGWLLPAHTSARGHSRATRLRIAFSASPPSSPSLVQRVTKAGSFLSPTASGVGCRAEVVAVREEHGGYCTRCSG